MSKKHRITKQIAFLILILIFLTAGCLIIAEDFISTTIEIDPTGPEIVAHVHKKPIFSKSGERNFSVTNVYQAIMAKDINRYIISFLAYRVELKTPNGKHVPITDYSILRYFSNRKLKNKINDSIQSRMPFKTTFREFTSLFFGVICFLYCALFIFLEIVSYKITKERLQERRMKRRKSSVETNTNPELQQPTEPNPEKYKNINDSIIK